VSAAAPGGLRVAGRKGRQSPSRSLAAKEWLPDLDSNQNKLIQSQLCYRYTIKQ